MGELLDKLRSRKFLLALFGCVGAFLTEVLGVNITPEAWSAIVSLIISYIAVEGVADIVQRYKKKK